LLAALYVRHDLGGRLGPSVALIEVEGLIQASVSGGFMGASCGAAELLDQLRKAEDDESVKAVVVWLDSPGGAAAAAHSVYQRLMELRKKKPVVATMGDVAASGAYYIASGANKIVASPGTETGSIGVIYSLLNVSGLMERYGVAPMTVKSGRYKDMGSPFRQMRPDEQALIQGLINDIYQQFVEDVAAGRNMPVEKVRKLADGRVYTGREALKLGLVDQLGSRDDGIKLAAKLGGIEGWPRIKQYAPTPELLRWLISATVPSKPWYAAVLERPGAWLTLPLPGSGMYLFPGLARG
jgi:protease-4